MHPSGIAAYVVHEAAAVAFTPDGLRLLVADHNVIRAWDVQSLMPVDKLTVTGMC